VKSLQPKQRPIDHIEQGELAKDPPLTHVYQDEEKRVDAHIAIEEKGRDKAKE